jgi:hypothetical protein
MKKLNKFIIMLKDKLNVKFKLINLIKNKYSYIIKIQLFLLIIKKNGE